MNASITRDGRYYYVTAPYAAKDHLRGAGFHWDPDRRAWWTGKREKAEQVAQEIAAMSEPSEDAKQRAFLERDKENILGRASYRGRQYYLVGEGQRSDGSCWVRLLFRDGSRAFFASESDVHIEHEYQRPQSLHRLQAYAESMRNGGDDMCYCTGTPHVFASISACEA